MFFTRPSSNPVGAEKAEATPTPERQIWDHLGECGPSYVRDSSGECVPNAALEDAIAEAEVECPQGYTFTPYSQTVWCVLIDENGEEEWVDHTIYDGLSRTEVWALEAAEQAAMEQTRADERQYYYYRVEGGEEKVMVPDDVELRVIYSNPTCFTSVPPGCPFGPIITLSKGDEFIALDGDGTLLTMEDNWWRMDIGPNANTFDFVPTLPDPIPGTEPDDESDEGGEADEGN